jgi:AcrR family transcriptional regulator
MQTTKPSSATSSDQTRQALVRAALELFGENGFDGTSTREIAARANANIASIAYHFGGKEGLRDACADFIVETIQAVAGRALPISQGIPGNAADPEGAQQQMCLTLDMMVNSIMGRPEIAPIIQFMLREMAHPTAALDRIYAGVVEPVHKRLCQLWETATGEPAESEATRITVFTVIGQVIYFRIGREVIMRRMGWSDTGPRESGMIAAAVKANLDAMFRQRKDHVS